jgi:aminoglycoside 3-N-acetyltransferase I
MRVVRVEAGEVDAVVAAGALFDRTPDPAATAWFLAQPGHHLLLAFDDAGTALGFVTGVETTHPDKGTEMFLYELGVAEEHRRQGVATALVETLAALARERGCYGMWVATEAENAAALATYRAAGARPPEPAVTLGWTF